MAIVAAALAPLLFVLAFNELALRQSREAEVHDLAVRYVLQVDLELDRLATGLEGTLNAIAASPEAQDPLKPACDDYLSHLKPTFPQLSTIGIFDPIGNVECWSAAGVPHQNFSDRSYLKEALASPGHMIIGEYTLSRVTGKKTLPLALAFTDRAGAVVGILATGLDLDWLGGVVREHILGNEASLTLADRNGIIIGREPYPDRFIGTAIPKEYMPLVHGDKVGTVEVTSQDGTRRILGYSPVDVPPKGLYVSTGIARDDAFAAIDAASWRAFILAAIATLVAASLSGLLGRRLVRGPIQRIKTVLAKRRAGDGESRTGMSATQGDLEALGAAFDVYMNELNAADEHRQTMTRELSHRMKNLLATVQAIASQTLRKDPSPTGVALFSSRLQAIARAQDVLVFENFNDARLDILLEASLSPFQPAPGDRCRLSGPAVWMTSRAALSISMAMHELATNAVKYGALSVPEGRVDLTWHKTKSEAIVLVWAESGGPPVLKPQGRGFGSVMIERVLSSELNGGAELFFEPRGLLCRIELPSTSMTPGR